MNGIKNITYDCLAAIMRIFPIKNNKIIFFSNDSTSISCNPKYIAESINGQNKYDIVWSLSGKVMEHETVPDGMRAVRYRSPEFLYELATAKVIISNHRLSFTKRAGQKYIQTWHRSMRLKKIEGDAPEGLSDGYIKTAKRDSANTDVITSGCRFSTDFFRRAFWYGGQVEATGTPRVDYLLGGGKEAKKKVQDYFNSNDSYVLYAPTFRWGKDVSYYNIDSERIVDLLGRDKGWKVLVRLHPNVLKDSGSIKTSESEINATAYSDIQELIAASDIVITDYSSLMFDCAFIHKPCILYMPDYEEYTSKERGLYFDIRELPFPQAYTIGELTECIKNFDKAEYDRKIDEFLKQIGSYEDGHACERIGKLIYNFTKE